MSDRTQTGESGFDLIIAEPLISASTEISGLPQLQVEKLARFLTGPYGPYKKWGIAPSILNNNRSPLQLCVSVSRNGTATRLIGDPATTAASMTERVALSINGVYELLEWYNFRDLFSLVNNTIDLTLPDIPQQVDLLNEGALWIAGGLEKPGVALYTTAQWGSPDVGYRWERMRRWLAEVLGNAGTAVSVLDSIAPLAEPASAAIEGTSFQTARAKVYFRLTEPTAFSNFGIEQLTDPRLFHFLQMAIEERDLPRSGLVLSVGFNTRTGELSDVKVDVCAHCVPRSARSWGRLISALVEYYELAPFDLYKILLDPRIEMAFIGMGFPVEGVPRLNLYLKASDSFVGQTIENHTSDVAAII